MTPKFFSESKRAQKHMNPRSTIGYRYDIVVCPSVCLSVTLCIFLWLNDTSRPPAAVCKQMNRKCPLGTRFYNFQPIHRPYPLQTPKF